MRFNFNETQLINLILWKADKYWFEKELINYEYSTDDIDLKYSINSLLDKVKSLSQKDVERLYQDKFNYKTKTFPQYELKKDIQE